MVRNITLTAALFLSASSALAEDGEIVLKVATVAPLAQALNDVAPDDDWVATPAEPMAARTKADILIESISYATTTSGDQEPLIVSYDTALLDDAPYAVSDDGWFQIFGIDTIEVAADAEGGFLEALEGRGDARIIAPRDVSWADIAAAYRAYLVVEPDGTGTVLIPGDTALVGVEPDEIDVD